MYTQKSIKYIFIRHLYFSSIIFLQLFWFFSLGHSLSRGWGIFSLKLHVYLLVMMLYTHTNQTDIQGISLFCFFYPFLQLYFVFSLVLFVLFCVVLFFGFFIIYTVNGKGSTLLLPYIRQWLHVIFLLNTSLKATYDEAV